MTEGEALVAGAKVKLMQGNEQFGETVITGKTGNALDPQGQATRAEAAAILQRFLTLK